MKSGWPDTMLPRGACRASAIAGAALGAGGAVALWTAASGAHLQHSRSLIVLMALVAGLGPIPQDRALGEPVIVRQLVALACLLNALGATVVATLALSWMTGSFPPLPPSLLATAAVVASVATLVLRTAARWMAAKMMPRRHFLIYGATEAGIQIALRLAGSMSQVKIDGFVDDRTTRLPATPMPHPLLGGIAEVFAGVPRQPVDGVIIAVPGITPERLLDLRARLRAHGGSVLVAPDAAALACGATIEPMFDTVPLLRLGPCGFDRQARLIKRLLDIVVASFALLVFLPLLLVCALAIKMETPGPVIYRQRRFGQNNRLFDCYKLRTMRVATSVDGTIELTKRGDARVTRVGAFLRRTSLDEIPQFMNVLQGHMSVVGPRPHPPGVKAGSRVYEEVISDFSDRYAVKPGITGLAQVSGLRGNTFTEEHLEKRFRRDIDYIRNWSVELDFWIILKTVAGGFGGSNAF